MEPGARRTPGRTIVRRTTGAGPWPRPTTPICTTSSCERAEATPMPTAKSSCVCRRGCGCVYGATWVATTTRSTIWCRTPSSAPGSDSTTSIRSDPSNPGSRGSACTSRSTVAAARRDATRSTTPSRGWKRSRSRPTPRAPWTTPRCSPRSKRALAELPEGWALVLRLRAVEEMSTTEIATALDLPLGTVLSRLSRARARIAIRLAERYGDPRAPEEGTP